MPERDLNSPGCAGRWHSITGPLPVIRGRLVVAYFAYVRISLMEHDLAPSEPVVVEGLLFREYFVGRFSIGGNGLAVIHGSPPPPRARMTFSA